MGRCSGTCSEACCAGDGPPHWTAGAASPVTADNRASSGQQVCVCVAGMLGGRSDLVLRLKPPLPLLVHLLDMVWELGHWNGTATSHCEGEQMRQ